MRREITLGDTLYVPNPTRPLLRLNLKGTFPKGVQEQARSISSTIRVKSDVEIDVVPGSKDGYDRKRKKITLSPSSFSPSKVAVVLPQLVGLHFWFHFFTKKERKAYTATIKDLPDALEPMRDFAVSFDRFWKGSLKQPRRKLLHSLLVKVKGPWEPRDLATQMGGPRNPKPERKMPIPSPPGTPNPDSQFH